jgi:D-tyrosyl-tRNA(Tyr) deacylase
MIALIQKVSSASVYVSNKEISHIDNGLLILLGIKKEDSKKDIEYLVSKICNLKILETPTKHILVVSQFTLYADLKRGSKPSFSRAMNSKDAKQVYQDFIEKLKAKGMDVQTGEFGAMMQVELINDGPVTYNLTSDHIKVKNT